MLQRAGLIQGTSRNSAVRYQYTVGYATTDDATTNAEECYRSTKHARAHDVSGLPALIRASVINFVIVCTFQLSVCS